MKIRHVGPDDQSRLIALLEEMERHYEDDTPRENAVALVTWLVSGDTGGTHTLVADDDGRLMGFAICNEYVPAGYLTRGLFMKDLFVSDSGRSRGIGRKLIEHVAALARERNCTRVHWTTGTKNVRAQKLYDEIGAEREAKVNYVVEGTLLDDMAAKAKR